MILGDRGQKHFLKASNILHEQIHLISSIRHDAAKRISGVIDENIFGWPELTRKWVHPNNCSFEFLTNATSLLDEGNRMKHCVATYSNKCESGSTHIARVRNSENNHIGTAEFLIHWNNNGEAVPSNITVQQFRGMKNCKIGDGNVLVALEDFRNGLINGDVKVNWEKIHEFTESALIRSAEKKNFKTSLIP